MRIQVQIYWFWGDFGYDSIESLKLDLRFGLQNPRGENPRTEIPALGLNQEHHDRICQLDGARSNMIEEMEASLVLNHASPVRGH